MLDKPLTIDSGIQRWKVEGRDRERRGWSRLVGKVSAAGNAYIVGSFGVWEGNDDGKRRIEWSGKGDGASKLSAEEIALLKAAHKEAEKRLAEERKREVAMGAKWAGAVWAQSSLCTEHEYPKRKQIQIHGLRVLESTEGLQLAGLDNIDAFRSLADKAAGSSKKMEDMLGRAMTLAELNCWRLLQAVGALVVPMHDKGGQVCGVQFVYPKGHPRKQKIERDKEFWPSGMSMGGSFGLVGPLRRHGVLLVTEGYATAASLHEATGLTVAYAFSANNLAKAGRELRKAAPRVRLLFCADDDYLTDGNPGVTAAAQACAEIEHSAWIKPDFSGPDGTDLRGGKKLSDFNDLHVLTGLLPTLANQINAKLDELGWSEFVPVGGVSAAVGGGESAAMPARLSIEEAVVRFVGIYGMGGDVLFDMHLRRIVHKKDAINLLPRHGFDALREHPGWRVVLDTEIGFDPSESDPAIKCNLFGPGWPTVPRRGKCERLLDLLYYLVSREQNARDVYGWVLKWLAYPLQHPGAKMQSAIVVHGPQGTGKSRFFEAYGEIFGPYSRVLGQEALDDKFNSDWAEKKLFILADEILARAEMYHIKNRLKGFITGDTIRVNPKNIAAHTERNCMNIVFLSNERQPLVLENDDRRHCVIWTPPKPDDTFFAEINEEIDNGGVAALHDYLLELDISDFKPWTKPPMTEAKLDLIDLGRSSEERFLREWQALELTGEDGKVLPFCPCLGSSLYRIYVRWCRQNGEMRPRPSNHFINFLGRQPGWTAGKSEKLYVDLRAENRGNYVSRKMVVPSDEAMLASWKLAPGKAGQFIKSDTQSKAEWLTIGYFAFEDAMGADR